MASKVVTTTAKSASHLCLWIEDNCRFWSFMMLFLYVDFQTMTIKRI